MELGRKLIIMVVVEYDSTIRINQRLKEVDVERLFGFGFYLFCSTNNVKLGHP